MISDIAGISVGAVMCIAGGSKIAKDDQWPHEARTMGAPKAVIPVLPWVEIILGALLVARLAEFIAGIITLLVIISFTALIIGHLLAGRHPVCACFGNWSMKPLGWQHVLRNVILIALTVLSLSG